MSTAPATAVPKAPPRLLIARERPEISLCSFAGTAPWVMFIRGALIRPMPMPVMIMPGRKAHWSASAFSSSAIRKMPPTTTSMPICTISLGAMICVSLLTRVATRMIAIVIGRMSRPLWKAV